MKQSTNAIVYDTLDIAGLDSTPSQQIITAGRLDAQQRRAQLVRRPPENTWESAQYTGTRAGLWLGVPHCKDALYSVTLWARVLPNVCGVAHHVSCPHALARKRGHWRFLVRQDVVGTIPGGDATRTGVPFLVVESCTAVVNPGLWIISWPVAADECSVLRVSTGLMITVASKIVVADSLSILVTRIRSAAARYSIAVPLLCQVVTCS